MARITDGRRIVELELYEWKNNEWGADLLDDFLVNSGYKYDEDYDAWIVGDIPHAVNCAHDWENCRGDFSGDSGDPNDRRVGCTVIRNPFPYVSDYVADIWCHVREGAGEDITVDEAGAWLAEMAEAAEMEDADEDVPDISAEDFAEQYNAYNHWSKFEKEVEC